jgi:DNA-binding response OmpR family regulator
MRLLLIEDHDRLAELTVKALATVGFATDRVAGVEDAEAALAVARYDAIILDLGLPDGDGLELMRRLRRAGTSVPILVATARSALGDRIKGLDGGADDYLVKPFEMDELAARLRALLRRPGAALGTILEIGNIRYDSASRTAEIGGKSVPLTRRETDLLEILLRRAGRAVSKASIEEALYGFDEHADLNAIEVLVSRLRKRLVEGGASAEIHTLRGIGYLLRSDTP